MVGRPKPAKVKAAEAKRKAAKGNKSKAAAASKPHGVITTSGETKTQELTIVQTSAELVALGKFEAAIERLETELKEHDDDIAFAEQLAESLTITDQAGADEARDNLLVIKDESKSIEARRKAIVEIPTRVVSKINALVKSRTTKLDRVERKIKDKIALFLDEQAKAQQAAWEDAEASFEAGDTEAAQTSLAQANSHALARKPAGFSTRKKWQVSSVYDPGLVPREWCVPDMHAIQRLAASTPATSPAPDIPGVNFELVNVSSVR